MKFIYYISILLISCSIINATKLYDSSNQLNEIAFLGAHNVGYIPGPTQNQEFSIPTLLKKGVRFFKLPVHPVPSTLTLSKATPFTFKGKKFIPMVCHGLYRSELYKQTDKIREYFR